MSHFRSIRAVEFFRRLVVTLVVPIGWSLLNETVFFSQDGRTENCTDASLKHTDVSYHSRIRKRILPTENTSSLPMKRNTRIRFVRISPVQLNRVSLNWWADTNFQQPEQILLVASVYEAGATIELQPWSWAMPLEPRPMAALNVTTVASTWLDIPAG